MPGGVANVLVAVRPSPDEVGAEQLLDRAVYAVVRDQLPQQGPLFHEREHRVPLLSGEGLALAVFFEDVGEIPDDVGDFFRRKCLTCNYESKRLEVRNLRRRQHSVFPPNRGVRRGREALSPLSSSLSPLLAHYTRFQAKSGQAKPWIIHEVLLRHPRRVP